MAWLHCDTRDGSVVSCSEDSRFSEQNASDTMRKEFVNIYTDMTIEEARTYTGPLWKVEPTEDDPGEIDEAYKYKIDLTDTDVVPAKDQDKIADRTVITPLVKTKIDPAKLVKKPLRSK